MALFHLVCLFLLFNKFYAKDVTVSIPNQGDVVGVEISRLRIQKIIGYYGVPYAQPPVDNLRFFPPVIDPLPRWDNVRNQTSYKPSCLQTPEDFRDEDIPFLKLITNTTDMELSEDCLYLNIFVPYGGNIPKEGFPTMVWFHPGHFTTGSPNFWNPHLLVYRHRVIVVTVAFRINIMGFFTTMDGEAPGNFGLMDQQAALKWIKNNIALFNGDNSNISLMGYGTGGTAVALHMINKSSQDLFNKAIIMSSNFLNPNQIKNASGETEFLDNLAHTFGCIRKPTSQLIDCLRRADGKDLVQYSSNRDWKPIIDAGLSNSTESFLPEHPLVPFKNDAFSKIPVLTGYTNMENILSIKGLELNNTHNASSEELQTILKNAIVSDTYQSDITDPNCSENNTEHIIDTVMFLYGPNTPSSDVSEIRRSISDFTTDRNYGSSTYMLASLTSKNQPTFAYRFDKKPDTALVAEQLPSWITVPHLFDMLYAWGVPYWRPLDDLQWDRRDKQMSDMIMSFLTNFAKASVPTGSNTYQVEWNQFTPENPTLLIIDKTFNMSSSHNLNYKSFQFWNNYYPKVVEMASKCCSYTDSAEVKYFNNALLIILLLYIVLY